MIRLRRGDSASRPIVATLLDFDNLVDYAYLFAGWMAIIRQILFVEYGLEKPFMSLYCGSAWLRILELGTGGYWGVEADAAFGMHFLRRHVWRTHSMVDFCKACTDSEDANKTLFLFDDRCRL